MNISTLLRRVAAPAATLALAAGTVAVVQAPAQAADYGTFTQLQVSHKKALYGTRITVRAQTGVAGTQSAIPYSAGNLSVQMLKPGGSWVTINTHSAGGGGSTYLNAPMNVQFRAVYGGGSYGGNNFGSSVSSSKTLKVARKLSIKDVPGTRAAVVKGKISPKATKKIKIKTKVGKRWKAWKTVKARKGTFKVTLKGRNGQKFRFYTPKEKKFIQNWSQVTLRITYGKTGARVVPVG